MITASIQRAGVDVIVVATSVAEVADAPITLADTASVNATEGSQFSGLVVTFTDADPRATLGDFPLDLANVAIDWGDQTAPTAATNITQPGGVGTPFFVYGSHTYGEDGPVNLKLTINDVGTGAGIGHHRIRDPHLCGDRARLRP